jgi:hypothetical protein
MVGWLVEVHGELNRAVFCRVERVSEPDCCLGDSARVASMSDGAESPCMIGGVY